MRSLGILLACVVAGVRVVVEMLLAVHWYPYFPLKEYYKENKELRHL